MKVKSRPSTKVSSLGLECLLKECLSVFDLPLLDATFLFLLSQLFLLLLLLLLYLLLLPLKNLSLLFLSLNKLFVRYTLLLTDLFMLGSVFLAPTLYHFKILLVVQILLIILGSGPITIIFWLTLFLPHIELKV